MAGTMALGICMMLAPTAAVAQPSFWNAINPNTGKPTDATTSSTNPAAYNYGNNQSSTHKLQRVKGFEMRDNIYDLVPLGDNKSFIIVDSVGFTVYRKDNGTVKVVGGVNVTGLQKVDPLGDGRSFVARTKSEFMVYEVTETQVAQRRN